MNDRTRDYIMRRDFSNRTPRCLYCKRILKMQEGKRRRNGARTMTAVLDHLDGNLQNNNPVNLALAHPQCVQARSNNPEYQNIAGNKRDENAGYCPPPPKHTPGQRGGKEGNADNATFATIEKHLEQEVGRETREWDDLCYSILFQIGREGRTIHIRTVEMYVKALCSPKAPWQTKVDGGEKVVSRRPGQGAQAAAAT